jgi:hypothetical protein
MAGKKGGLISGIGNATGLTSVVQDVARPFEDLLGGGQRRDYRRAKTEERRQIALQAEAEAAVKDQENVAIETEKQRKKRVAQRAVAGSRAGRSGTILTSPLGDSPAGGDAGQGGKTLLGV